MDTRKSLSILICTQKALQEWIGDEAQALRFIEQ